MLTIREADDKGRAIGKKIEEVMRSRRANIKGNGRRSRFGVEYRTTAEPYCNTASNDFYQMAAVLLRVIEFKGPSRDGMGPYCPPSAKKLLGYRCDGMG